MPDFDTNIASLPTQVASRIVCLDVLRGFALLGILTINITAMGMTSTCYFDPLAGKEGLAASAMDLRVWMAVDVLFEGAFRTLFSMLFGAGIVLFTTGGRAKSGRLHYRRTFWLLIFGLFDAYILLWYGDILMVYAIAGAMLYWLRNLSATWLYGIAACVLLMTTLFNVASTYGLGMARDAHRVVESMDDGNPTDIQRELSTTWIEFRDDLVGSPEETVDEIASRRASYASAFAWNVPHVTELFLFVIPVIMLWDAILMMLIGMALFKKGLLQGLRTRPFYGYLSIAGFIVGLPINGYEVWRAYSADFELLEAFTVLNPSYHIGRLAMAMGYLGLVIWWCKGTQLLEFRQRLSAVGRMALTNYLMHSLIALLLFTGAGFGLVGKLERWQLYPVILVIWVLQLWFSSWWLRRRSFGPVEALWRRLTYGRLS